jgi:predicted transcriptional regulator of viral defense system
MHYNTADISMDQTRARGADLDETWLREAGLGAFFRPSRLEALGISYDQLQRLVATGAVEKVARGLYRLTAAEPTEQYSLAAASARVPHSIVCLLSALKVHGIGTQLPREVWLAIPHKARAPKVPGIRVRLVRFTGAAWTYGVRDTEFEGVPARVTNPARTIVDCFRFERLVGREAAMEALRDGLRQKAVTTDQLLRTLEVLPSRTLKAILDTGLS